MTERKMHADEVDVDLALVRSLLEVQFPQWAELRLERVTPAGTDNVLYRLGRDRVVRLPRRQINSVRLEKERRWLPRLATSLPLAIPVPLAIGKPEQSYPFGWAVYRWLEGDTATIDRLPELAQTATDLARFIAALESVDPRGGPLPGEHNAFRGVPLEMRDESTRAAIASLGDTIDGGVVTTAWDEALSAPSWQLDPVWIHGDLDARNLLVQHGRLCAVIDFGCLGVGDPACDVMVAWKLLTPDARDIFRKELSIDEATWARARGWALSQAVIALSYYTLETNPVLVSEALRWMSEALADQSPESQPIVEPPKQTTM
jgi:aminoglycoside phosphotransferase (APT) family kinase protein